MRFDNEEWHYYVFSELFNVSNGINKDKNSFGYGFPIVNYMDVNKYAFLKKEMIKGLVNSTANEQKNYSILPTDLLITRTSETIDEIAYSSCILDNIPNCVFSGFLLRARPKFENLNTVFMVYILRSPVYRKLLQKYSTETSRTLINSENLKKLPLMIPHLKTQNKIANFLMIIDSRITTQMKIIEECHALLKCIRDKFFCSKFKNRSIKLNDLINDGTIELKRGQIIPKKTKSNMNIYPVYSSSTTNEGLLGYHNDFMFDEELITWSIDGGGNFFYREKHKFNVTNVCGYMKLNTKFFNYRYVSENLIYQHNKMKFDYQTKAHPSIIATLYTIIVIDMPTQERIANIFNKIYEKIKLELKLYENLCKLKKYLLSKLFI